MKKTSKKASKSDSVLVLLGVGCCLGIVSIIGVLIIPVIKSHKLSLETSRYQYTLTAGRYEVGVDIPAGTYKAHILEKDKGYFTIYESLDGSFIPLNTYRIDKNEKSSNDQIEKVNTGNRQYRLFLVKSKVRDVTLEQGLFVEVHFDATIVFYANEIQDID